MWHGLHLEGAKIIQALYGRINYYCLMNKLDALQQEDSGKLTVHPNGF